MNLFEQKRAKVAKPVRRVLQAQGWKENVAAFLFWEYPKPKIPQRFSEAGKFMMVSVTYPGVIQVFDFSSKISLRNFYAVYPPHTNAATSLSIRSFSEGGSLCISLLSVLSVLLFKLFFLVSVKPECRA
jgi:hypothetical protein